MLFRELRGALAWPCACLKALGELVPALRAGSERETAPPLPVLRALELTSALAKEVFLPYEETRQKIDTILL